MLALINFDAAATDLVEELVADGRMPALRELRGRGRVLPLETPAEVMSASVYASVWSGLAPGDHGLYFPFQWQAGEQRVRFASGLVKPEAMWERLSRAGRSVLVVDAYEAWPPAVLHGTYRSGWQFSNRVVLQRVDVPARAREWQQGLRPGPAVDEVLGQPTERGLLRLRDRLLVASGRAADLVVAALAVERPDLLVVGLPAVHLGGHQLWEPVSVLQGARRLPRELETALRDVYVSADRALGRIIAALPADADVVVFSATGMGPVTSRADLLPAMTDAVLSRDPGRSARPARAGRFRAALPVSLRARVAALLPDRVALELACRVEMGARDWSVTRAFAVPSDGTGLVRLNLRGREREGIVPESDVDELVEELAAGLTSFMLPSGEPVVSSVDRTATLLEPGGRFAQLPDLVVRWSATPTRPEEQVTSSRFGSVRRTGAGSGRSGGHTGDAWALVAPGASRARASSRPARVTDLAATALALQGLQTGGEPLLEPT